VVTAAGNDGNSGLRFPVLSSLHTPGTAPSAITVGATMNSHLLFQAVRVNGSAVPSGLQNMRALFGDGPKIGSPLTAPARDVARLQAGLQSDGLACSALPAGSLAGAVAVIQRGTCVYSEKITNAQNAGAVGVILYQLEGIEDPVASLGVQNTGIPAVMIGNTDGKALKSYLTSNSNATVSLDPAIGSVNNGLVDTVAPFSSRGPSLGNFATTQDFALKPELVAPGTDLYTAAQKLDPNGDAYNASGYTTVSGTSYAVGMVAGAVALVKQKNSAIRTSAPNGAMVAKLKSAVVNTASGDVQGGAHVTDVGAGKLNVGDAVNVAATLEPAAISFGAIPAGALPINRNLVMTNVSSTPATFNFTVRPITADSNARLQVPPGNVTLSPGQSSTLTVSLIGLRPASGAYEGFIDATDVTGASPTLHLPYLYLVGSGVPDNAFAIKNGGFLGLPNEADWLLGLKVVDQYGVPVPNAPVSFRVQSGGGKISRGDNVTDRLGIAAVFVQLGPQLGEQVFIGTAGGLSVEFDGYARPLPSIKDAGVVNAAPPFQAGQGLAPGSYISIFGDVLADATVVASTPALPLSLASVAVSFDGGGLSLPGHLHFVSPSQINVQIPWEFQGQSSVKMKVTVSDFLYSNVYTVPLAAYSPGVFATADQIGGVVSQGNPAKRGQVISIYANGLGDVDLKPASGDPTPSTLPLANTKVTPVVTIGGVAAPVQFSGLAPGFVGLYQVNVLVPANAPTGTQPLKISIGGIEASVNLPVQL
jgi:minor extracellular serine protease Vpr